MPQPFNYMFARSPNQAFLEGTKLADTLVQRDAEQQQAQQQNQLATMMAALPPTAGYSDYMAAIKQAPQFADALMKRMATFGEAKKTALFDAGGQAYALLQPDAQGQIDATSAIAKLEEFASAFENSGDADTAKQLRDTTRALKIDPVSGRKMLGTMLAVADGERFKNVAATSSQEDRTAFQKDFEFIKQTFGPAAASEYAQFGRSSVVSIPLGNGQTYVGPASMAPGAEAWKEKGVTPETAGPILAKAAQNKTITAAEAGMIKESLGPAGKGAFEKWRKDNGVKVIVRSGLDANGRRVVQYDNGEVGYAD